MKAHLVSNARRLARGALGISAAAVALVGTAGVASADVTYDVPLNQDLPIVADEFSGGECPTVPSDKDGWHFVIPDSAQHTVFVELRVTFDPGGQQTITDFGPPTDKHAFAQSEVGAELVAAEATVKSLDEAKKEITFFNLSHTCPGKPGNGETTPPGNGETTPPGNGETTPPGENETTPAGAVLPKTGSGFPVVPFALLAMLLIAAGTGVLMRGGVIPVPYRRRH